MMLSEYAAARTAGATHAEIMELCYDGWAPDDYIIARAAGATHQEAQNYPNPLWFLAEH
jgi:hypothetical protein